MMKIVQAPAMDEASRAALASGRAEPALGLFIDTLLEMNGITLDEGEALSGAILETENPADMSPHALDMAFAAIERGGKRTKKAELLHPELSGLPAVLRSAVLDAEGKRGWGFVAFGISSLNLDLGGQAKAEVLRIDKGVKIAWHTHRGQELTLCLSGEFSDGFGTYGPGDYSLTDDTIRHQPVASEVTHVFALTVVGGGLKFEGLLGALQKLFGQG
jgi:putative transcriptional regulator